MSNVETLHENLKEWLLKLVAEFREKFAGLSPEEKDAASRSSVDLSEPCQLLVIWAKNPEFQIVIVTRLTELDDKFIQIYGPIENENLTDFIEKEIFKLPIVKLIGQENFEDFLTQQLRIIVGAYSALSYPKPQINGIFKSQYASGWVVFGNLLNLNMEETVKRFIENIVSLAKPQPSTPPRKEEIILEGFGTYVYPPIWIGEPPKPKSFKEKVFGTPFWLYAGKRVLNESYKSRPIIFTRDGYIAIEEKDKSKAQELLNEIMGALLLCGISVNAIREIDIGEASFRESGSRFSWNPVTSRAWLYYQEVSFIPFPKRAPLTEEKIKKIIKLAELLTSDDRIKTIISLFLEAHTYFVNTEYKQALIISWIILEDFYIKDLWASHISKISSDKKRLKRLMRWTVDTRLEALSISNALTNEEYELLKRIKNTRNDVVHEGQMPQKEVVDECLKLVSKVVKDYVGKHLGERLSQLL